jgi:hypothetical protein
MKKVTIKGQIQMREDEARDKVERCGFPELEI